MKRNIIFLILFVAATLTVSAQTLAPLATKTDYAWKATARDATVYEGKVYVMDYTNTAIHVLNGLSGVEEGTITDATFVSGGVSSDGAGNLYLTPVGWLGNTAWKLSKIDLLNGNAITALNDGAAIGNKRADFIEAYKDGDVTYIAEAPGGGNTVQLEVYTVTDNTVTTTPVISVENIYSTGVYYNDARFLNGNLLLMTGQDEIPQLVSFDAVAKTFVVQPLGEATVPAAGSAYFTLGNKEYVVFAASLNGAIQVFDITSDTPEAVGGATADLGTGNTAAHLAIDAMVSGNGVYIYVWCPSHGLAIYTFGMPTSVKTPNVDSNMLVYAENGMLKAKTTGAGIANYTLCSIDGRILNAGTVGGTDIEININHLPNGVYLLQATTSEGVVVKKFMKK